MSTILDALRKAEQERDLGKVPDLRSVHAGPVLPRQRNWLVPGLVVLLANAALLAWFLGREELPGRNREAPDAVAVDATAPPPPPAPAPAQPVTLQAVPGTGTALVSGFPERDTDTTPAPEPDLMSLPPETVLALRDIPLPQPLAAMPESFQRSLPSLNLDVHVYSDDAARRFVLINGRRYREGDWVEEGPLLETIATDGVIMNHQQSRFMIPIER